MKPKKAEHKPQRELFRVELSFLVDANHPLVKLGGRINWAAFEKSIWLRLIMIKRGRRGLIQG